MLFRVVSCQNIATFSKNMVVTYLIEVTITASRLNDRHPKPQTVHKPQGTVETGAVQQPGTVKFFFFISLCRCRCRLFLCLD